MLGGHFLSDDAQASGTVLISGTVPLNVDEHGASGLRHQASRLTLDAVLRDASARRLSLTLTMKFARLCRTLRK